MITELKRLWQQAFGDSDAFLDAFFSVGYSPDRCRYLTAEGRVQAMLYWFDGTVDGRKYAYLYAIATDENCRNQGLCRRLMTETHDHLRSLGYAGALLVPGSRELFRFYEKLGYATCCHVEEFSATAGAPIRLWPVDTAEFSVLRQQFLPEDGLIQDKTTLEFLAQFAQFYAGDGFVLAVTVEDGKAHFHELLGNAPASGILAALGCREGHFRTPGKSKPFAMFYPLNSTDAPCYLGLALD